MVRPSNYRSNPTCRACNAEAVHKRFTESFITLVKSRKHELLSPYVHNTEKVLIDFKCGHEPHWIRPRDYKHKNVFCPKCTESKGEKIIREWLETNQIEHFTQYKLSNKRWRYDFYIPSENLIVEVQGLQHYKFVEYFHKTKENFYKQANEYNDKWAYARLKLGLIISKSITKKANQN